MDTNKIFHEMDRMLDVSDAINYANRQKLPSPNKPKKPFLQSNHSSKDVEDYFILLKKYEKELENFEKELKIFKDREEIVDNLIEEYIKKKSGLYTIPDRYRKNVYNKAYEDGHSEGFLGIYNALLGLVEIFE